MEVLYGRCAGLDVHKDSVVACARVVSDGVLRQAGRRFRPPPAASWLCPIG